MDDRERKGMRLLDVYARKYCARLKTMGLWPEFDDLRSEMSVALMRALSSWDQNRPEGAAFETYLIRCFRAVVWRYALEMQKAAWLKRLFAGRGSYASSIEHNPELLIDLGRYVDSIKDKWEKIVAMEAIDPSPQLVAIIQRQRHERYRKSTGFINEMARAISELYGKKYHFIRYRVEKLFRFFLMNFVDPTLVISDNEIAS